MSTSLSPNAFGNVQQVPTDDGRICKQCGEWKQRDEFHAERSAASGMRARCRTCCAANARERYYARTDESRAKSREQTRRWYHSDKRRARATSLRHEYGITMEQYEAMLAAQDNKCAICGEACPTGMRLSVDHCHETGVIRGLLCKPCNMALGQFRDDPERLLRAVEYLRRSAMKEVA